MVATGLVERFVSGPLVRWGELGVGRGCFFEAASSQASFHSDTTLDLETAAMGRLVAGMLFVSGSILLTIKAFIHRSQLHKENLNKNKYHEFAESLLASYCPFGPIETPSQRLTCCSLASFEMSLALLPTHHHLQFLPTIHQLVSSQTDLQLLECPPRSFQQSHSFARWVHLDTPSSTAQPSCACRYSRDALEMAFLFPGEHHFVRVGRFLQTDLIV
jgi:hypothetical protein